MFCWGWPLKLPMLWTPLTPKGSFTATSSRRISLSKSAGQSAINDYFLSAAYAAHGDKEKALATLRKTFELGFHDFVALDASPYFASLRGDSRFQHLTQRYRK